MAPSIWQSSLSFLLKFLNYLQTFLGVSVLLYSLWLLNDWNRRGIGQPSSPWFVYTVMSVGGLLCLIAFFGYVSAGAKNGCCLCSYAIFTSILILVEAVLMADLVFNKHWKEDFPHDATGQLQNLQAFIEANIDIVKWIVVAVVSVQAFSLLLAIILRAMIRPRRADDGSDDEFAGVRSPLLNPRGGLASDSTSIDRTAIESDPWRSQIRQKYGLAPSPPSMVR